MTSAIGLIPILPVAAAAVAGFLAIIRKAEKAAPLFTLAATLAAGVLALMNMPGAGIAPHVAAPWVNLIPTDAALAAPPGPTHGMPPGLSVVVGVTLDPLSWIMVLVVCSVSALVQIYSIGYMAAEKGYARYYCYLALFTASMLGLVTADNLFQLYVGWELVGVCSYLLFGFWWFKPSAANAAKKAFVVTRFGDVGFMLGVLLLVSVAQSFKFTDVFAAYQAVADGSLAVHGLFSAQTFLWLAPLLLLCGAIGKSAQFPLHVWLPDAMEGPTPVSALIHAATMVAAGVYMVARLILLFTLQAGGGAGAALDVVMILGAVTALIAATIALVQVDIKKVMAYSTISQLGYMMVGLGVGGATGQVAGMFHLVTHACFKALLFLTAGSVIHALHHAKDPNDMRSMGGLMRRMPHTAITCGIGVLALAGFPLLSGFWSKDAILAVALQRAGLFGHAAGAGPHAHVALACGVAGLIAAFLTAVYSARMWLMTFWGKPRSDEAAHAHESPAVMTLPLWALAIPSVAAGFLLAHGERFATFVLGGEPGPSHENMALSIVASAIALAGLGLGALLYARCPAVDPVTRLPRPVYALFSNLWYVDAFWSAGVARGSLAFGRAVAWFDRSVIDASMHGIAWLVEQAALGMRRSVSGQTQTYAAVLVAGTVAVVLLMTLYEQVVGSPGPAAAAAGWMVRR